MKLRTLVMIHSTWLMCWMATIIWAWCIYQYGDLIYWIGWITFLITTYLFWKWAGKQVKNASRD